MYNFFYLPKGGNNSWMEGGEIGEGDEPEGEGQEGMFSDNPDQMCQTQCVVSVRRNYPLLIPP